MNEGIPAYPLQWPADYGRTAAAAGEPELQVEL